MHSCPYDHFAEATIKFCEDRLCAWIVEPANTWSNIGYLLAGLWVLRQKQPSLNVIGYSALAVFVGSTLFHATATLWAEFLDLAGMYLFSGLLVAFNAKRLGAKLSVSLIYYGLAALSIGAMAIWPALNIPIFAVIVTCGIIMEILIYNLGKEKFTNYRDFWIMAACFAVAFTFWGLDISGVWCNPDNHIINGHALWHLSNAWCFVFIHKFYNQIKALS